MARRAPLGLLPRLIHCQHFPPFALSSACSIFSSESFQSNRRHVCVCAPSLSRVRLFSTPWTVACQAPLSKGFSRQEYWGELPFPSPGDLPDPGIKTRSPTMQADSLPSAAAAAAAKSLQSCPTLCDPIDSSPPGSPIPGILQARTLEWVVISFSNA